MVADGFPVVGAVSAIVLITVLVYLVRVYCRRRHLVKYANKLPSMKLNFYHVFGHLTLVMYHRILKRKLPTSPHVFGKMVCEGFPVGCFVSSIVLVFVLAYMLRVYCRRRPLVKNSNKLPSLKLNFYNVFGHSTLVKYHRILNRKLPTSRNVYDFQGLQGYSYLFPKENITNIWQLHLPFVQVYKADSVEMILNHSTELKKAWFYELLHPWLGKGLLTSHDEQWKRRRKMLTPAFHFNILQDFLPVFNKQSKILVDVLSNHTNDEFVDIVPLLTRCSLDIICETILGKELHTQTQKTNPYVKAITELTSAVFERMQTPWLWNDFIFKRSPFGKKFIRNVTVIDDFTMELISEKKKQKSENMPQSVDEPDSDGVSRRRKRALLDLLLDEQLENNSISVEEIREEVNTFTFEGHDTTSMSLSWSLYLIGLHPWVQESVHSELDSIFGRGEDRDATADDLKNMKYLENVIKESLRIYPSVPAFGRRIRNDIEFEGRIVPEGSTCLVNAFLLHRNPEVFPNPERFDPDRFLPENSAGRHPFAYVPFSAGPRNCIGQRFALMEKKTILSSILRKYQVRSLDPRDKVHLVDELVLRPLDGLRVQVRFRDHPFDSNAPPIYYRP